MVQRSLGSIKIMEMFSQMGKCENRKLSQLEDL
jgi:hypothetical protein